MLLLRIIVHQTLLPYQLIFYYLVIGFCKMLDQNKYGKVIYLWNTRYFIIKWSYEEVLHSVWEII